MAQSSRYFRIDDDVLLEFIYHDQSNPNAYEIDVDDNGSEVMFLDTDQGNPFAQRHLISELGGDVVNFDVTDDGAYIAVEGFAARTLLLQNGKTYKFNVSALALPTDFDIEGTLGIKSYDVVAGVLTFVPNTDGQTSYTYPNRVGGKITVDRRANPLFSNPDEDTGNDINQTLGRFHAVQHEDDKTKYALIGYDSTGVYDKYNYINNSTDWQGSNSGDLVTNQAANTLAINYIKYDTIRLHLRSGYSFAARGYEGFLFEVTADRTSGVKNYLTQLVYLNQSNYEYANPKPFILGETLYSKFIELKVPTLVQQNQEFLDRFYGDGTQFSSDVSQTSNYGINFKLIDTLSTEAGFDYIYTGEENKFTISREDEFQDFTVVVEDALDGDYFKIYGEKDNSASNFEGYILNRIQTSQDDIAVFFDIEVFEQVGVSNIKTATAGFTQYEDFDTPIVYRPVIQNANVAVNFSIDVTMRIYNTTDNTQIVKRASLTVPQAAKYGKTLQKLTISSANKLTEIYNILPNTTPNRIIQDVLTNALPRSTKQVIALVERHNVVTSTAPVQAVPSLSDPNTFEIEDVEAVDYVNNSQSVITIPPFTTYVKFKFAKKKGDDLEYISLNNVENVVLTVGRGEKALKFNHYPHKDIEMIDGEVLFKIDEGNAKIINGRNRGRFYISLDNGNEETMLTTGRYRAG
jgi:hypothetical protein